MLDDNLRELVDAITQIPGIAKHIEESGEWFDLDTDYSPAIVIIEYPDGTKKTFRISNVKAEHSD